jgi:hypothetical protein
VTGKSRLQGFLSRTLEKRATLTRRFRPLLFAIAGTAFVIGTILSWRALPDDLGTFEWWPLVIVAVAGVPATILLNAGEYQQIARIAGLQVTLTEALRIAVLSTAANLAPLPGALLVRWGDMSRRGSPWRTAIGANFVAGAVWLTLSALALMVVTFPERGVVFWIGLAFALVGAVPVVLLTSRARLSKRAFLQLAAVETGLILVTATRAFLILEAFALPGGITISVAIASTYSLSGLLGVFPGGLGVREVLSGLVSSPATGGVSTGFLVSAVDRLIGLAIHVPLAAWLSAGSKRSRSTSIAEAGNG